MKQGNKSRSHDVSNTKSFLQQKSRRVVCTSQDSQSLGRRRNRARLHLLLLRVDQWSKPRHYLDINPKSLGLGPSTGIDAPPRSAPSRSSGAVCWSGSHGLASRTSISIQYIVCWSGSHGRACVAAATHLHGSFRKRLAEKNRRRRTRAKLCLVLCRSVPRVLNSRR